MYQNDVQRFRDIQINDLQRNCPDVKTVSAGEVFDVPLAHPFVIRITFPERFPYDPPTCTLLPPGSSHPFAEASGQILSSAHQNLSSWSLHASLGKTALELKQLFTRTPPQITGRANTSYSPTAVSSSSPATSPVASSASSFLNGSDRSARSFGNQTNPGLYGQSAREALKQSTESHISLPPIPSSFPEIERLSDKEIEKILADDQRFEDFFALLDCVVTMKGVEHDLMRSNADLAGKNMEQEQNISKLRQEVQQASQALSENRREYDALVDQQKRLSQNYTKDTIAEKLAAAADDAERESDALLDRFLEREVDLKEFQKQYLDLRRLYHSRSAKRESLLMHK